MRLHYAVPMILAALCLSLAQSAARPESSQQPIVEWLRAASVPLADEEPVPAAIDRALERVRVVGLGEATHGQHESFETKRKLTMHLVRKHGFRIVAYEASGALARRCDDYVNGKSSDADAALKGLGMMIWMIEENVDLLNDLRAWNASMPPSARVRFVGVDVQDSVASAEHLHALLLEPAPELAARAKPFGERIDAARDTLYSGNAEPFDALWVEVIALRTDVERAQADIAQKSSRAVAEMALTRARDLERCMSAARVPSGRDAAMAEVLLEELERSGEDARAVVWAHNAHVTKGPLRHMQIEDPGMGGVLRERLEDQYYAVGFLFGTGEFAALARTDATSYAFRTYALSDPPAGSFEAPFVSAQIPTSFVDLRVAPADPRITRWLDDSLGQRWFGGYGIPDDFAEASRDLSRLQRTVPRKDFDGLVFLSRTSASRVRTPK